MPAHAFDPDEIAGAKIPIRNAIHKMAAALAGTGAPPSPPT